jgi:hypothetical protein
LISFTRYQYAMDACRYDFLRPFRLCFVGVPMTLQAEAPPPASRRRLTRHRRRFGARNGSTLPNRSEYMVFCIYFIFLAVFHYKAVYSHLLCTGYGTKHPNAPARRHSARPCPLIGTCSLPHSRHEPLGEFNRRNLPSD